MANGKSKFPKFNSSNLSPFGSKPKNGNKKPDNKLMSIIKGVGIYVLIALAVVIFVAGLSGSSDKAKDETPLSQIVQDTKDKKINKIEIEGNKVTAIYKGKDPKTLVSRKESGESIYRVLESASVDPKVVTIEIKDNSWQGIWLNLLGMILPVLLMFGLIFFLLKQAGGGGQGGIFSFGQSRARLFSKDSPQVKFTDVAGAAEAKRELAEVVEFLKTPQKFKALGARIPKGVLLVGPAGVGKTLLARAVAGEAGVPFFSIAGSEFMEMLVGVGAARVRDMFAQAKKAAPAIIFIDEIESIGRQRGMGMSGGHDEREQTLNQILVEMDGFAQTGDNVIVVGATNRPDLLDTALVRPGRFDRRVMLNLPDIEDRKSIIELYMKGKPFAADVSVEKLARRTVGFSGADLFNVINEAAILTASGDRKEITYHDLEESATKEKLGPQRKRLFSERERKLSAYHEAGHAIVGHFLPMVDPVHRISIVSRGMSGGHTMFPPTEDRSNETKSRLLQQISAALGGQAAEELTFNDISTGASSDIETATSIAKQMVTQFGMSSLGPINISPRSTFGWKGMDEGGDISPELHNTVDKEIKKIIDAQYKEAMALIKKNKVKFEKVAKELLEKETLEGDEFEKIVGPKKST